MAGKGPEEQLYVQKFKELLGEDFKFEGVVSWRSKDNPLKKMQCVFITLLFRRFTHGLT